MKNIDCRVCGNRFRSARRTTCSDDCFLQSQRTTSVEVAARRGVVVNKFLPADAEENQQGIWVPSPAEIEEACKLFRDLRLFVD